MLSQEYFFFMIYKGWHQVVPWWVLQKKKIAMQNCEGHLESYGLLVKPSTAVVLGSSSYVPGMCLACAWYVPGVCLACAWRVLPEVW